LNTILVHRKKETNTLYTINALNELIKKLNGGVVDIAYKVNDKKLRTLGWFPKIMIINEAINIYNSFDPRRFTTKT
jgi:hypothetical protein